MAFDAHTREGAAYLAQQIREYWAKRGKTPIVSLHEEPFTAQMREAYWVIRSDMRNGMPQVRKKILETKPYEINAIAKRAASHSGT